MPLLTRFGKTSLIGQQTSTNHHQLHLSYGDNVVGFSLEVGVLLKRMDMEFDTLSLSGQV
jgi:hypothetical protein